MSSPFNPQVINDLIALAKAHNEAHPDAPAKLSDLKKIYRNGYKGRHPAEKALAKVQASLAGLAKAFEGDEHPRAQDGKFSDKGGPSLSMTMPSSEAAHRRLQASNAGYRAMTSEAIPDHRHETAGAVLREGVAGAAGVAAVASLSHGSKGFVGRQVRRGGKLAGQVAGGAIFGGPAHVASYTLDRIKGAKTMAPRPWARSATRFGVRAGGKIGDVAGRGAAALLHGGVDLAVHAAPPGRAGRWGVLAGLSVAAASAIGNEMKGSSIDPQEIGRGIDNLTYRTVEKVAGDESLAKAYSDIRALIGPDTDADALRKSVGGKLFSGIGRHFLGAAAAAAAGAAAGGAAHVVQSGDGKHKGNPYHDEKGRFTHGAAATVGASLLGGAAAGLAVYTAIRNHQARRLNAVVTRGLARSEARINSVAGAVDRHPKVAKFIADKPDYITGRIAGDKTYQKHLADLDGAGNSAQLYYKETVRQEINRHLGDNLSQIDGFALPIKLAADPQPVWRTMGELRAMVGRYSSASELARRARDFVATATPADFKRATQGMSEAEKARHGGLFKFFDERQALIDQVDGQMAGHAKALTDAHEAVAAAEPVARDAAKVAEEAHAAVDAATDEPGLAAAQKAHKAAATAAKKAAGVLDKARVALQGLKDKGADGVMYPISKRPIPPASETDQTALRDGLKAQAMSRAARDFDNRLKDIKRGLVADTVSKGGSRRRRLLVAQARLGLQAGAVSGEIEAKTRAAVKAFNDHEDLSRKLSAATADHKRASTDLAALGADADPAAPAVVDLKAKVAATEAAKAGLTEQRQQAAHRLNVTADAFGQAIADRASAPAAEPWRVTRRLRRLGADLARDLDRVTGGVAGPVNSFIREKTAGALSRWMTTLKEGAGPAASAAADEFRTQFRHAFMRKDGDKWVVSPAKVLMSGTIAGAAFEGARDWLDWGKTAVAGTAQERAQNKVPSKIKVEHKIDPLTGHGFVALSAADPHNKAERILLWGNRLAGPEAAPETLFAGARMSDLRQRVDQAQQRQQGGGGTAGGASASIGLSDVQNMDADAKTLIDKAVGAIKDRLVSHASYADGPAVVVRPSSDNTGDDAANKMMGHVRSKFLNTGSPNNGLYFHALSATVGSNQGRVLKAKQAYTLLTGYNVEGEKKGNHGIFAQNADFASKDSDEVVGALSAEVQRVPPRDALQRANLARAVAVVGAAKNLSAQQLAPIYEKIKADPAAGAKPASPGAAPGAGSAPGARPAAAAAEEPKQNFDQPNPVPEGWDASDLHEATNRQANRVSAVLGIRGHEEIRALASFLDVQARTVSHGYQGAAKPIGPHMAAKIAANALIHLNQKNPGDLADTLMQGNISVYLQALGRMAREFEGDPNFEKLAPSAMDDIDGLVKLFGEVFDASLHPRAPGGSGGGQFTAKGVAGRMAREAIGVAEEMPGNAARRGLAQRSGEGQPWYAPKRIGNEFGGNLGGELAWQVAARFLPAPLRIAGNAAAGALAADGLKVGGEAVARSGIRGFVHGQASKLVGLAAKTTTAAGQRELAAHGAKTAGALAYKGAAGIAGSVGGGAAGSAASDLAYAKGKAPDYNPPEYHDTGEWAAETAGSVAGGMAGLMGGGVLASAALGAAGSYAGGIAGRQIYNHFAGYNDAATKRVLNRHMPRNTQGSARA